jgi:hypothetical protein
MVLLWLPPYFVDKQKINPNSTGVLIGMGGSHLKTKEQFVLAIDKFERYGMCINCGWCCERNEYYYYPEDYSAKKAKILAYNECNTSKEFIKRISTWVEQYDDPSREPAYRVVKIEIGCDFLEWRYDGTGRKSFCTVYNDSTVGCNYERRKSFPESPLDLGGTGTCGYKFKKAVKYGNK